MPRRPFVAGPRALCALALSGRRKREKHGGWTYKQWLSLSPGHGVLLLPRAASELQIGHGRVCAIIRQAPTRRGGTTSPSLPVTESELFVRCRHLVEDVRTRVLPRKTVLPVEPCFAIVPLVGSIFAAIHACYDAPPWSGGTSTCSDASSLGGGVCAIEVAPTHHLLSGQPQPFPLTSVLRRGYKTLKTYTQGVG